ncbi:MFS-type transporter SLC18B1-like [Palaemon carinicauda]|uniref:MFS-type transporter SLC18B1-like n=1 Tax=Palaemon carinicauda TaxID=392227 RepID=UPI0035B5CBF6
MSGSRDTNYLTRSAEVYGNEDVQDHGPVTISVPTTTFSYYSQVPVYPEMPVGSETKDFVPGIGACANTSGHLAPPSPATYYNQAIRSSHSWHHSSSSRHPSVNERSSLLGKSHRSESNLLSNGVRDASVRRNSFSRKQILTLASMLLIDFSSFASMSVLAPFFPKQALTLNLGPTFSGVIFSVYALVIVLVSPIIGKFLPLVNSRKVYLAGIMVAGLSDFLFGMTYYIKTSELFVVMTITLRIITALGTAAFLTVIYSVVPVLFPDDMNMVNGMMETAVGIGMCVGPAVGVWLYSIGGFGLPFYGLGGFLVLCAFISYLTFPSDEIDTLPHAERGGVLRVLCRTEAILSLVILCVTATCLALLYPTLQPHMNKLGVSVEGVGLVYLLMSAVYALSSPLVGLATDRFHCPWGFMSSGLLIMSIALVLLGNSPLLPYLPHEELYIQDVTAIVFLGLSSAMSIVPTYGAILEAANRDGNVDMATYAVVGGLWSSSYSLGEVLGPLLAGSLAEYISFAWSTTVIAILPAALAILCGAFMCVERHRARRLSTILETSSPYA